MDNLLFKSGNSGNVNIDEAQGIVECFVAGIGNKDSVGDVVISGAFAKSLTHRKPRVVWGHSWNDPIGKVLEMYEVPVGDSRLPSKMRNAGIGGLYAKVQFNLNSEKGKEAFATVAFFGEEQEWSIGYKTIDSVFDPNLQANILKEVELYEVSPVLHGANQLTGTISIKADEKGGMPVIPMQGMGMPMMPQIPRIVVIAAPQEGADGSSEGDPFAQGMSQELSQPDKAALQAELAERTGSKIEVMNATENSVVFRRTTQDGKASMYRLPYHREGNQYMFGKPEPYASAPTAPQATQNIEQKPGAPVVVPNGGIAYRTDDQMEMMGMFGGGESVESPWGKSGISHLIEMPDVYMQSARDFLSPVLRHHRLKAKPSTKGIIIDGLLTANALDALQNAVKALGATIGQAGGNIGQAIGKIRDLAQTFNPYALDGDGDGFVQDGSAFMRPYIPIKKPGFDLPDVRGRKRSGDALLDKPRSAPKLPKDRKTWTRAQRNEALTAGTIEPETREDVAYLANRRPDNEGLAKYWDMSEADLTKEGNRLVNARRQATGAEKERIDEELLKVSHDFQRRASYAETFGQEFVPPAKREVPEAMVPEVDKPEADKPDAAKPDRAKPDATDKPKPAKPDITEEEPDAEELASRERERALDEQADAALDNALEKYIEKYGEDDEGFASSGGSERPFSNTEIMLEVARRDGWRGNREPSNSSKEKARDAVEAWEQLDDAGKARLLTAEDPNVGEYVGALLKARDERNAKIRKARTEQRNAARKLAEANKKRLDKFRKGDLSMLDFDPDSDDRPYINWSRLSQEERDRFLSEYDENDLLNNPDLLDEVVQEAFEDADPYEFMNDADRARAEADAEEASGFGSRGDDPTADLAPKEYARYGNFSYDDLVDGLEDYRNHSRDEAERIADYWEQSDALWDKYFEEAISDEEGDVNRAFPRAAEKAYEDYLSDLEGSDGFGSRGEGEFGSKPEDSAAAKVFDSILEKYWKMWGFDVPDDDEEGWDEPFGFASRGNDEEVKQSKLDELVSGVKDRLIAELETADPSTWKPSWRSDSLPINPTTGKPYRGMNAFFLMLAAADRKYNTGRFAGFNQLKARGAIVRKGEKGIPILRPQLVKKEDEDGNLKEFVVFRGATVFNVDQTDGGDEALRAIPADLPESERIAILDETLKELGVTVQTADMTPHYSPDGDYISMPDFAKGTSALEWTSTLAHEAVHWTGHSSRLKRASLAEYSSDKKVRAYEELVAEIGSAMVLAAHGIEAPFRQDHAPYIKGWIQLLKDDPDALNRAFKDAQAAVNFMLEKSPNLRKLFGGIDTGKRAPEVDAPDKAEALVGASDGFASLHRVRTPGSSALGGILYDDNSRELMVGFLKGKSWDDLGDEERENWIDRASARRGQGGYERPLSDTEIDDRAKELYEDSRDIGWYVYSDVSMEEVQELAAVKSKGKHINALKKLKRARKATDEDNFNFFGRDERIQDVAKAKPADGFASSGIFIDDGIWLMRRGNRDFLSEEFSSREYRDAMSGLDKVRFGSDKELTTQESRAIRKLANLYLEKPSTRSTQRQAIADLVNMVNDYRPGRGLGDGFASSSSRPRRVPRSNTTPMSVQRERGTGYITVSAMVTGGRGAGEEDRGTRRMQITLVGGSPTEAKKNFLDRMAERNLVFAGEDGFASRGGPLKPRTPGKRIGVEPRYQDRDWVNQTQERILAQNLDFASLSEDDQIDWVNSMLGDYLDQNEMGHNLADLANGRRLSTRPDMDLLNYAEQAYARMSDAHMARRAQYGDQDGFASVGRRTRRLGIKPSQAVDYVSYDPESESLFVAYKREDGRGDMYVYEGVSMDDAIGVENAESVGRAINDIKRRKNVRKATPEEIVGLSDADKGEARQAAENKDKLRRKKLDELASSLVGLYDPPRTRVEYDDEAPDGLPQLLVGRRENESRFRVEYDPDAREYVVTPEYWDRGDSETPGMWEDGYSARFDNLPDAVEEIKSRLLAREADDDAEARVERELDEARRELDMAGDAPGVESVDVTYSSALDAVDYNPSTQELRVTYKDGGTYIYEGVDRDTFEGFKGSPSRGRAMNDIKRAHPYRKDGEWAGGRDEDGGIEEFDVRGSEAVEKVTYDPDKEELTVVYSGGKGYIYSGVTREEADAVRSAPSKGRAINDVKRTHDVRKVPTKAKGEPDMASAGWSKGEGGKWSKGDFDILVLSDDDGNYRGLLATNRTNGAKYEQEAARSVPASDHLESFEGILRGVGNLDEDTTTEIDPAPVAKPKMPTRRPPRGGKRVRNRNVTITMEQGALDEIIEAEGNGTTVDALRAARGVGTYTKGPRKGKRRGPDTIAVRDAETGELLHANEIELTSSSANWYEGRKQGQSPTGRKRGYIRARSYAGRQGHNVVSDEGPNLRGEGRGMTDYDKRVYGLGSDEKNREAGLASRGGSGSIRDRISQYIDNPYGDGRRSRGTDPEANYSRYSWGDDEASDREASTAFANTLSRSEAREMLSAVGTEIDSVEKEMRRLESLSPRQELSFEDTYGQDVNSRIGELMEDRAALLNLESALDNRFVGEAEARMARDGDGFASRGSTTRRRGAGMQNYDYGDYPYMGSGDVDDPYRPDPRARKIRDDMESRVNQNLGEEIVMMDDGNGNMVPTAVHWGSRPNSKGVRAKNDWLLNFLPKGEWAEIGVGDSSAVKRVWIKRSSQSGKPGRTEIGYFDNEVMVMFKNGSIYHYEDVLKADMTNLVDAESMGRAVREITHPEEEGGKARKDFTRIGSLADALKMVRGSYSGDRGEDGYYTGYPRGEESSYEDYVAKLYEEADAALESQDVAGYKDIKGMLVEEGRLFGGPGDSREDVDRAHREHYLENFGLTEEQWNRAGSDATDGDGFASRGYDPSRNLAPERYVGYGIERYGNFSKEELLDGLELDRNRDQDEAERIADYWEQNDALWDEYFETAIGDTEGDVLRAFSLAADRAYEDYLSDLEGSDGFASGGYGSFPLTPREVSANARQRARAMHEKGKGSVYDETDDLPEVENQYDSINAWQLLAPSTGDRGRVGNYKQWNVMIVKNDGRYDVVKEWGKLEDADVLDRTGNQSRTQTSIIERGVRDYGRARDIAREAVEEKLNSGSGYRLTATNDKFRRKRQDLGPGTPLLERVTAEHERYMRRAAGGSDGFASRGRELDWEETKRGSGTWNAVGNNPRARRGDSIYTITRDEDGKFGVDAAHGYSYQRDGGTDYDEEYFDETFDTLEEAKDFVRRIDDSREPEGDDGFAMRGANVGLLSTPATAYDSYDALDELNGVSDDESVVDAILERVDGGELKEVYIAQNARPYDILYIGDPDDIDRHAMYIVKTPDGRFAVVKVHGDVDGDYNDYGRLVGSRSVNTEVVATHDTLDKAREGIKKHFAADRRSGDYPRRFGDEGDGFASRGDDSLVPAEYKWYGGFTKEDLINDLEDFRDIDRDEAERIADYWERSDALWDDYFEAAIGNTEGDVGRAFSLAAEKAYEDYLSDLEGSGKYGFSSRGSSTKPSVDAETQKRIEGATLGELARMIRRDLAEQGKEMYFGAVPYIDAMSTMDSIDDRFGEDSGQSIVAYALGNLQTYRGPKARAIKAELNKRLKEKMGRDGFASRGQRLGEIREQELASNYSYESAQLQTPLEIVNLEDTGAARRFERDMVAAGVFNEGESDEYIGEIFDRILVFAPDTDDEISSAALGTEGADGAKVRYIVPTRDKRYAIVELSGDYDGAPDGGGYGQIYEVIGTTDFLGAAIRRIQKLEGTRERGVPFTDDGFASRGDDDDFDDPTPEVSEADRAAFDNLPIDEQERRVAEAGGRNDADARERAIDDYANEWRLMDFDGLAGDDFGTGEDGGIPSDDPGFDPEDDLGFASSGERALVIQSEWMDFDELDWEVQDQIIQDSIDNIDRVAQPDIDLEEERDLAIDQWNNDAKAARAKAAESLLKQIDRLIRQGVDDDNRFQRYGSLITAEELIKNTDYVSSSELASAQSIVDGVRKRAERLNRDSDGFASRAGRFSTWQYEEEVTDAITEHGPSLRVREFAEKSSVDRLSSSELDSLVPSSEGIAKMVDDVEALESLRNLIASEMAEAGGQQIYPVTPDNAGMLPDIDDPDDAELIKRLEKEINTHRAALRNVKQALLAALYDAHLIDGTDAGEDEGDARRRQEAGKKLANDILMGMYGWKDNPEAFVGQLSDVARGDRGDGTLSQEEENALWRQIQKEVDKVFEFQDLNEGTARYPDYGRGKDTTYRWNRDSATFSRGKPVRGGSDGFASRAAGAPTKTSLRRAATEQRAEIRSMIQDQQILDRDNPMERRAYDDMEKRIEDAQRKLMNIEREIDGLPPIGDTGRRMPGEGLASRTTLPQPVSLGRDVIDRARGGDTNGLIGAIREAMKDGKKVKFSYNGKERELTPVEIWQNPKVPGRFNMVGEDAEGVRKNFSLDKFSPSEDTDFGADMDALNAQRAVDNFTRLSSADQNMYFQRALANNRDSGMTTEQILDEARKLAMDDRRIAELEREAVGMGQSSKPRKIDVSSSSALNSVEYDEMNRRLSVEYRGRDGKGTGTVYTYDGVEPDVVDRIEASDSRGATMREVRDNYEFTTSRKLPDSAYEGLASRSGFDYALDRDDDDYSSDVNAEREKLLDLEQYLSSVYGESFEEDGTMDLDELIAKEMKRQRMGKREATSYARQLQKDYLDWRGRSDALADMMLYDDGFASRGRRRSTDDMRREFGKIERLDSTVNRMNASEAVDYRERLINARNQAAREMARANGVAPKKVRSIYDVSPDEDDQDLLDEYDRAIDTVDSLLDRYKTDKSVAEAKMNASANALGEAQELAKRVRAGSSERRSSWDSDEEFINAKREDYDLLIDEVEDFFEGESSGDSYDGMESETLEHGTYVRDVDMAKLDGLRQRLKEATTESGVDDVLDDLDNMVSELPDSFERRYREDEAFNDYDAPSVPDNLLSDSLTTFFDDPDSEIWKTPPSADWIEEGLFGYEFEKRRVERLTAELDERKANASRPLEGDGFASRGRRRRPGRRNQGKRREGMAPKTRYSEEDRQNIADRNVLRSRKRPGKRRGGPDASEWDGFASMADTERDSEMPVNPTKVFEGGEHGPGKDISLNKMWDNYREKLERITASGKRQKWDALVSDTPLYHNVEVPDGNGGFTLEEEVLFYPLTIDDFMERFGPDSRVGLDEESVRRLFDSRRKGSPEFFIDDPSLAEKIALELGFGTGQREGLFGFDPLAYFDDTGAMVDRPDEIDAAVDAERARRTARLAARAGRAGKRDIIERRRDAAEPSRPVGEMSLREFEDKLFENTGVRVRLTDDNGNALSAGAMMRNVRASGLPFVNDKGTPWSEERYRQMQRAGYLPNRYARELVDKKILKESDLARRDAISDGEFGQWPGFRELGGSSAKKIRDALIEMGLFEEGRSIRSIEEALGRAGRGARLRIKPDRLGGKGSVLLPMAKVREMVERLGLDAEEFEKWFRRTDNFTDGAPSAPTE